MVAITSLTLLVVMLLRKPMPGRTIGLLLGSYTVALVALVVALRLGVFTLDHINLLDRVLYLK